MQTEGTVEHQQQQPETGSGGERSDVVRLSWPVAAAALLGLLVVVLVGAFMLDRQFRAPVGLQAAAPTVAGQQVQPTALAVAATAVATATSAPAPMATVSVPPAASAAASPSPMRTVDPQLAREIGAAYERYWAVRAGSLLSLDTSHLAEVMAEEELAGVTRVIEQLRAEGRAIKTDVTLNYTVTYAVGDEAEVYDEYTSRSAYVHPTTREPLGPEREPSTLKVTHFMKKVDGTWKVIGERGHD